VYRLVGGALKSAAGGTATVYSDSAGTTLADIRYYDPATPSTPGGAVSGSELTIDYYSRYPLFWFPDSVDTVYISVDGGPLVPVTADSDARLDALATRVTAVEAGGAGDALLLHKAGAENVTGVKTFTAAPIVPTPTGATQAANKGYVDARALVDYDFAGFAAVTNTTTDTALATLTVPAGATTTGSLLVFEAGGTLANNSGGTVNHTFRVKLGATTALTSAVVAIGTNASDREWYLRAMVMFPTASTQKVTAFLPFSLPDAANFGGGSSAPVGYGTASETMAADTDIVLSLQPATASASQSMQANWATLTRLA
jgi:hypothetical protein